MACTDRSLGRSRDRHSHLQVPFYPAVIRWSRSTRQCLFGVQDYIRIALPRTEKLDGYCRNRTKCTQPTVPLSPGLPRSAPLNRRRWEKAPNATTQPIDWQFTPDDARIKLRDAIQLRSKPIHRSELEQHSATNRSRFTTAKQRVFIILQDRFYSYARGCNH